MKKRGWRTLCGRPAVHFGDFFYFSNGFQYGTKACHEGTKSLREIPLAFVSWCLGGEKNLLVVLPCIRHNRLYRIFAHNPGTMKKRKLWSHNPLTMNKYLLSFLFFLAAAATLSAQMWNGRDTLYGNEWIDYDKDYYKINVAEDGMYRIYYETLQQSGLPLDELTGAQFQLFHFGEEVPLDVSTDGPLGPDDYLVFHGRKNRGELDRHLFQNPDEEMLNPRYSMFTDTSAYFLTWAVPGVPTERYEKVENDLTDLPAPEEYFMDRAAVVFGEKHSKYYIRDGGLSLYRSDFLYEGFGSGSSNDLFRYLSEDKIHIQGVTIDLPGLAAEASTGGSLRIRFGCGPRAHYQLLKVDQQVYGEFRFNGFQVKDTSVAISPAALGERLEISLEGRAITTVGNRRGNRDGQSIAFAEITYPRQFDFANQTAFSFSLPASSVDRYLEIERFSASADEVAILYDLIANERYEAVYENDRIRLRLPSIGESHDYLLVNMQRGLRPAAPVKVEWRNFQEEQGDYIILSHPALMDDGNGSNPVAAYADYRQAGYQPIVVDIQELYDQFSYGISFHPLSVRNFAHYVKRRWSDPKYLFIIGKGREFPDVRRPEQMADNAGGTFFVPAFGYPASDNLLLSDNESAVPVLPVGRIAATTAEQVQVYLDKVKDFEDNLDNPQTIEGRAWMKRVMHLGGGDSPSQRRLIRNYLMDMGNVIEGSMFGADVTSYYRTNNDLVESSISEQVFKTINEGLSIITFFGHSGPGVFEFNIDNPDKYENYGKYPLLLSLGCYSGNTFTNGPSISERFVFHKDRGAIAFGASRGLAFISTLHDFARRLYSHFGSDGYGRTIGESIHKAITGLENRTAYSYRSLAQQFNLHGDPAVRLHASSGPDYIADARSVQFVPRVVTAQMDSFSLKFDLVNIGRYQEDSLSIRVWQQLPSGEQLDFVEMHLKAPAFSQEVIIRLPGYGRESIGLNKFYITVDARNEIDELPTLTAENNNELARVSGERGVSLFIVDNTARPIYPSRFGIVSNWPIELKASTTNTLAPERTYLLELDTTARFNSAFKISKKVIQRGGVITWQPDIVPEANDVYYWRISPDSTETGVGYVWEQSSFTYLPGSSDGWNQGDYWQWLEGDTSELRGNNERRKLEFVKTFKSFRIKNKVNERSDPANGYINNARWSDFFRWERPQSINIAVFDTLGQIVWNPKPGAYGSLNRTASKEIAAFLFPVDTYEERRNIINFIEDTIPDNSTVFVYTAMGRPDLNLNVDQWAQDSVIAPDGKNLFNVLEAQGADEVRSLEGFMRPYIFGFRKNEEIITELVANTLTQTLNYETSIQGFLSDGHLISPTIGPASSWERFEWDYSLIDEYEVSHAAIIGISPSGQEAVVQDSIVGPVVDLSNLSTREYPFLRLQLYAKDSIFLTPPELKFWRVLYEGLPDVSLNTASDQFAFHSDTLQQGDPFRMTMTVENVSNYPIDSMSIQYLLVDENNEETILREGVPGMEAQGQATTEIELDTRTKQGAYSLNILLNPEQWPLERTYFNNRGSLSFSVDLDRRNPILDVTFDGVSILDGDIVSSTPQIDIRLEDENQFFLLQDTSIFDVTLEYPDRRVKKIALADNPDIQFYPADPAGNKNQASIVYTPSFTLDGQYTLRIKGRDMTGNAAGGALYEKKFEVINKKAISHVVNYPNPFSTSTRFVYTLTGNESPTYFKIQIMTTSGRIVRELTEADIGPLRIGTHQTEYAWDGRDDYGDELANGVYLYRVVAKDTQGKDFDYHDNGLQSYFKNGMGKLVILR